MTILFTVLFLFLMSIGITLNGYAFSALWEWFVVPSFSAPSVKIMPAIGIMLLFHLMSRVFHIPNDIPHDREEDGLELHEAYREFLDKEIRQFYGGIINCAVLLLFGWLLHQPM